MNILVENDDTLEYLTETGQWTKNPRDGRSFPAREAAVRAAKQEAIGKFNIVWHIPRTNQFINLDHGRGKGLPEPVGRASQTADADHALGFDAPDLQAQAAENLQGT